MWEDILKAKLTPYRLNYVMKNGMTKEFQSSAQILDRMQSTNSRFASNFLIEGMPSILKKLRREGKIENDGDNLEVWRLVNG
tara:strand:+ start:200 stop:445 length:246 start_codon:yes stop_codon:yes gene_type:complete